MGLDHEHIRSDRDDYLRVNADGVPDNLKAFFVKKLEGQLKTFETPYDLQSIMHYGHSVNK